MYNLKVQTHSTTTVYEGVSHHDLDADDSLVMHFQKGGKQRVSGNDLVNFSISYDPSIKEELLSESYVPIND